MRTRIHGVRDIPSTDSLLFPFLLNKVQLAEAPNCHQLHSFSTLRRRGVTIVSYETIASNIKER
jgi:hypothetical protein